jgi:transposase-like protein
VPDPPSALSTRVAVDESAVKINDEGAWVYAAIDIKSIRVRLTLSVIFYAFRDRLS